MYQTVKNFAREHLPAPLWDQLGIAKRAVRECLGRPFGVLGIGPEGTIFALDGERALKVYSQAYFDTNEEYDRPHEGTLLEGIDSEDIVASRWIDESMLELERLGKRVGTYSEIKSVRNPDALVNLLDSIGPELRNARVRHHDIHWSQILPTRDGSAYKLVDFGWSRGFDETGYDLPPGLNHNFSTDDGVAIDMLRSDLDQWLEAHPS